MKKLLALALAVVMCLSVGVMAFAASDDKEKEGVAFGDGKTGDSFSNVAVPGKDTKVPIQLIAKYTSTDKVWKDAVAAVDAAEKAIEDDVDGGHDATDHDAANCTKCKKLAAAEDWFDKVSDEDGVVILTQTDAWKAYDTDKSFKISFKATKGADYIKSYEIKKTTSNEMYVQVNYNELYLPGMKDLAYEITLTVTNNSKFNAKLTADAATLGITFARSEYVKFEKNNLKYGFNGANILYATSTSGNQIPSSSAYKDFEIKADSPTDYDVPANLDNGNGTGATDKYTSGTNAGKTYYVNGATGAIHYKKGTGEVYSFDYGNGDAYFEVKMDNQAVVNLYMSTTVIKAVNSAYPDAELLFWNWRGNPELDFTASVELYYDEDDMGDSPYLYKWDGTNLTLVNADFEDETCSFKTRSLGAYVMSDIELDAAVVSVTTAAATEPADATQAPDDATATTKTQNPNTGASDFVGVAVALAVVSLAAAGAVALKK